MDTSLTPDRVEKRWCLFNEATVFASHDRAVFRYEACLDDPHRCGELGPRLHSYDADFIGTVIPIGDAYPEEVVLGRAPETDQAHVTLDFDAWASRSHTSVSLVGDQ